MIAISKKRLGYIALIVVFVLFIPFIAMQFTDEVNWKLFDFVVAGALLFGAGLLLELAIRKVSSIKYRIVLYAAILAMLLLIWAELAVGIIETLLS